MQEAASTAKAAFYAVRVGHNPGIYLNWADCEKQVKGFANAKFKKFSNQFDALDFITIKDEFLEKHTSTETNQAKPAASPQRTKTTTNASRLQTSSPFASNNNSTRSAGTSFQIPTQFTPIMNQAPRPAFLLPTPGQTVPNNQSVSESPIAKINEISSLKIQISNTSSTNINNNNNTNSSQKRKITVLDSNNRKGSQNEAADPGKGIPDSVSMTFNSPKKPHLSKSPSAKVANPNSVIQRQIAFVKAERIKFSFNNQKVEVYTDGACTNNGNDKALAGVGVYWGPDHQLNISRRLLGYQTNNRAEIMAAIIALCQAIEYGASEVNLYTDSQYTINCINDWMAKWKRNGWKSSGNQPVKNVDELVLLDELRSKIKTNWIHVRGHKGIFGNEEADRLARESLTRPIQ